MPAASSTIKAAFLRHWRHSPLRIPYSVCRVEAGGLGLMLMASKRTRV